MWTVLVGEGDQARKISVQHDWLHALEAPPEGAAVMQQPDTHLLHRVVVPLDGFPEWFQNYVYGPASSSDLQLVKPENKLMFELYFRLVEIDSLTDEQAMGLAYVLGKLSCMMYG